jgi:uncharacterized membrane protein YgcG
MDKQFSRFNRRVWAAVAVSAAFLVPLGVFGAPALARSASAASEYEYSGSSQYQYKVTICHKTHSRKHPFREITVGSHAAKAHLRHGDTLGPCPTVAPPVAPKDHGHDNGDDHGNGNGNGGNDEHGNGNGHGNDNHRNSDDHGGGNGGGKGHH